MVRGLFRINLALASVLLVFSINALGDEYVVKKGDDLSHGVAGTLIPGPVWGKNGSLARLLRLNPQIKNPHLIVPGERIELGDLLARDTQGDASVLSSENDEPQEIASPTDRAPAELAIPSVTPSVAPLATLPLVAPSTSPTTPDDGSRTSLELTPFIAITEISSKDAVSGVPATVSSNFYGGVSGKFSQTWNDSAQTNVHAKLAYISYEPPIDSSSTLANGNQFLPSFGLGEDTRLSSRMNLGFYFDLEKGLFARSDATSNIIIDDVTIPSLGAKLSYDLVERNAFKISATGVYEEKFPASTDLYTVKVGDLFGGVLGFTKCQQGESQYEVDLGAFRRDQNTSVTNQSETTYEVSLKLFFPGGAK